MHVQRNGTGAADSPEINPVFRRVNRLRAIGLNYRVEPLFLTAEIREVVDVLRKLIHKTPFSNIRRMKPLPE